MYWSTASSMADFSWRVKHVKHLVPSCLHNLCFLNFIVGAFERLQSSGNLSPWWRHFLQPKVSNQARHSNMLSWNNFTKGMHMFVDCMTSSCTWSVGQLSCLVPDTRSVNSSVATRLLRSYIVAYFQRLQLSCGLPTWLLIIQGYYKINRHFQHYVVSKPLA
jgi:hypothetical protein